MRLFVALVAAALLASACASDSDADDASRSGDSPELAEARDALAAARAAAAEAEEAAAAAEAEAAAARAASTTDDEAAEPREFEGKIIRVTGPERSPEEWGAIEDGLVPWEEETGAAVIFTGLADWEGEIDAQLAAGNPPDIFFFPRPDKLAALARGGLLLALPGDVNESVGANWSDAILAWGSIDEVPYGVPAKSDLMSLVWHEPAVFEANGYEIPQTWDELEQLTNIMIADGITPWCVGIEAGPATGSVFTDWTEDLLVRFEGPETYDQWVANEVGFADERVVNVFDEILGLWNTPGAVFGGSDSIATTNHLSDPAESLAAGDCAMVRQASSFVDFVPESSVADLDAFYFPSIDGNVPILGEVLLAGAFTDRPEVWALMEYFGSPEWADNRQIAQRELQGGEGTISGFLSANLNADTSLWTPIEQSLIGIMQRGTVFRYDGSNLMPAVVGSNTFWAQATAMVNGEISTSAAASALDESWPAE